MVSARGFTIVELILVIGIIGILTGGLIIAINVPLQLQKARDGQRKTDLKQIQSALEFIRTDTGSYPASMPTCGGAWVVNGSTYLAKIPCTPTNNINYAYAPVGSVPYQSYTLTACLEDVNDPQKTGGAGTGGCAANRVPYLVSNP